VLDLVVPCGPSSASAAIGIASANAAMRDRFIRITLSFFMVYSPLVIAAIKLRLRLKVYSLEREVFDKVGRPGAASMPHLAQLSRNSFIKSIVAYIR